MKPYKPAIFVDSAFCYGKVWKKRKHCHKSNQDFCFPEIERNIQRDREVNDKLLKEGWKVLRFWGKYVNENLRTCADIIMQQSMTLKEKISTADFDGSYCQDRMEYWKELNE